MKHPALYPAFFFCLALACVPEQHTQSPVRETLTNGQTLSWSKQELADKIKGGWAGQVIGCAYGGPTEFRFKGTMIGDHVPIAWDETRIPYYYEKSPGLFDDIYMDLTFVEVFEKHGLDASDTLHAKAFAEAGYMLWHANQAARYNILNGMMPPASGHWKNNPHADDIDFQIEADFAGLMAPGMPNAATGVADKVGHIMNYGDGWYGGVYVAALYALAFSSQDIPFVVEEALKSIPPQSTFYQCINDVVAWHRQYPDDWKQNWFEVQKKWSAEKGCPEGVFRDFNIDAKINAAYVVIGLLYGQGDFGKSLDISTRCGQDSDCNPATVGGLLGTMFGYGSIPAFWKQGLDKVEDTNFLHTETSLNRVYAVGLKHALDMLARNGGSVDGEQVSIAYQSPVAVRYEAAFEGMYPKERKEHDWNSSVNRLGKDNPTYENTFEGCGFVLCGQASKVDGVPDRDLAFEVFVDDVLIETAVLPTSFTRRRHDLTWNYDLAEGPHRLRFVLKDIPEGYRVQVHNLLVYTQKDPGSRAF